MNNIAIAARTLFLGLASAAFVAGAESPESCECRKECAQRQFVSGLAEATPESLGIPSRAVLDWINACEREIDSIHSFVLMRKGKIAAEGYWAPYGSDRTHLLYSHSKSFTATAAGFLVQDGKLDLDETVASIFPDKLPPNPPENLLRMRVRDLLTMCTGSERDSIRPLCAAEDGDWVAAFMRHPVERQPGTHYVYNTGATYMVAAIVQKRSGMKLMDYLREKLFRHIGIEKAWSGECPRGIACGGYGMNMTCRELARFGQFCLNEGSWEGKQLLSRNWMRLMTSWQTSTRRNPASDWGQGYGFQFWRCKPEGVYRADGAFGQITVVMPNKDAVLSVTAGLDDIGKELNLVWQHLLPAMTDGDPLPDDPEALDALRAKCASLSIKPVSGDGCPAKNFAAGKKYASENSALPWLEAVSLEPRANGAWEIAFHGFGRVQKILAGNGKWEFGKMLFSDVAFENLDSICGMQDVAASGAWTADGAYEMRMQLVGGPASVNVRFDFSGDKPSADVRFRYAMGKDKAKVELVK